jgi:hypothetical protein
MAEGVELLEAITRFRADTSDVRRGMAEVEQQAKRTAGNLEQTVNRATQQTSAAAKRGAEGALDLGKGFGFATHASKELSFDIAKNLDPALGGLVRDLAGAGRAAHGLGFAFGGVAAAAAVVAFAIEVLGKRTQEAEKFQVELAQAWKTGDVNKFSGALGQLSEQMETIAFRSRTVAQEVRGVEDATATIFAFWRAQFGPELKELELQAIRTSAGFAKLFLAFESPARQLAAQKDLLAVQRQALATEQQGATTQGLINRLGEVRLRQLNEAQALTLAQVQIERERQLRERTANLVGPAKQPVVEAINREFDIRIQTELERFAQERRVVADETRKLAAAKRASALEDLSRDVEAQQKRLEARSAATRQILELEKELGANLAAAHAEERALFERDLQAQLEAIKTVTEARSAAFRERLAVARDDERPEIEKQFTAFLKEQEVKRQELVEQAALRATQLHQKQAAERVKREQETTQHLLRLGRATSDEEIAQLRRIASDESQSLATRRKAAEDLQARQIQVAEVRVKALRDLGLATVRDEIDVQQKIAEAAKRGSDQQVQALQKVIALQKQARQEARGALGEFLSLIERIAEEEGLVEVTAGDIERLRAEAARRSAATLGGFAAGGAAGVADLRSALDATQALEGLQGQTVAGALGTLLAPQTGSVERQLAEALGTAGEVVDRLRLDVAPVQESLRGVTDAYEAAFDRLPGIVGGAMKRVADQIKAGNDTIAQSVADRFDREIARMLELKRRN